MPSRHLVVAERRRWSSKRRSRWADLSFSPSRGISSSLWKALLVAALAAPCFPPKSPVHSTLVPGPTEPGNWPFFLDEQFRRTIIGPLLIPATATPGRLKQFLDWTSLAAWRARGFQQAILGLQRACESTTAPTRRSRQSLLRLQAISNYCVELPTLYLPTYRRCLLHTTRLKQIRATSEEWEDGPKAGASSRHWLATGPAICQPAHLPNLQDQGSQLDTNQARRRRRGINFAPHHITSQGLHSVPIFLSSRGVQCGVLRKGCFLLSVSLRQSRTRSADARVSPRRGSCAI
jgi:hypothetical protein